MEKYLLDEDDPDDDIMIKFFEPIKIIGKGAFSTVIEAIERISKK